MAKTLVLTKKNPIQSTGKTLILNKKQDTLIPNGKTTRNMAMTNALNKSLA